MRRARTLLLLILIVLIGAALAYVYMNQQPAEEAAAPALDLVDVIVAAQPIPQGGIIEDAQLATIQIPRDKLVAVMFTLEQAADVIGKKALYPIEQGVPITSSMIGEPGQSLATSGPEWATQILPGETAIAIPISRLKSVAYGATDGAAVNVIACMLFVDVDPSYQTVTPNSTATLTGPYSFPETPPQLSVGVEEGYLQGRVEVDPALQSPFYIVPSEAQRPRPVCQMFFQNVRVLHLGDFPYQDQIQMDAGAASTPAAADGAAQPAQTQPQQAQATQDFPPDVITLVVSPQDAVTLSYLVHTGAELTLTLRSPDDTTLLETQAATLQFILSQYNVSIPLKLPYAQNPPVYDLEPPFMPNDVITLQPQQ